MLVVDDYRELEFLSTLLQKLGFDTMSFNKSAAVGSSGLSFVPDLLVSSAKSHLVDGMKLALRIRKSAPLAKIIFLYEPLQGLEIDKELKKMANAFLQGPVEPNAFISLLASMMNPNDGKNLLEKYRKISNGPFLELRKSQLAVMPKREAIGVRTKIYEDFLKRHDEPVTKTLSVSDLNRRASLQDTKSEDLSKLNEEKKAFVRALFKQRP